jgi:hypothetical protein
MNTGRTLGIAARARHGSLGFAYHCSEASIDRISNALTRRYTDSTMWYVIAGIAAVVSGGFLTAFGRRI